MHLRFFHLKATDIDSIEAKQRQSRRKTARSPALGQLEGFHQVKPFNQNTARHFAPIVKISGND